MKKVFISVPMKNRTKENIEKSIEKIKQYAKIVIDDEIEFVNTIVEEKAPYNIKKEAIWYLCKSLEILSGCDILMSPTRDSWYSFTGCDIERKVAESYGIEVIDYDTERICKDLDSIYEFFPVEDDEKEEN